MTSRETPPAPDDPGFDPLGDLLDVLDLEPIDPTTEIPHEALVPGIGAELEAFVGRSQPQPHGRVFGGQVVAQAVVAAGRTVADVDGEPRHIHSLHGYFLRAGDADAPIRFAVERLRDGRSFSARRVHALQFGRPILSMIFSFQTVDEGLEHQIDMPDVPEPETLPSLLQEFEGHDLEAPAKWAARRAIDVRHPSGSLYLPHDHPPEAAQSVWLRADGTLPDDELIHSAVLAYASDYTILESIMRRHGLHWSDSRIRAASLDHSMWFHRPARADGWILYSQSSPSSHGGRGLGIGRMFTRDGLHIVTVAQEGMLRLKQ